MNAIKSISGILTDSTITETEKTILLSTALEGYSIEATKAAICQSNLNATQIEAILQSKGYQGELLKTTVDEWANAASTNAVAKSQGTTTLTTATLGTAFKGLGVKIKETSAAMWAFLTTNPVGMIIGVVGAITAVGLSIYKINKDIDEHKKKIIETGKEAQTTLSNIKSELSSTKDKVNQAIESYERLIDGVDTLSNKNLTLSDDEYEEFLSTNKEIADLFPELIIGYDAQGTAILSLGDNAEEAKAKLNELDEAQEREFANKTKEEMPKIFKGIYTQNKDALGELAHEDLNINDILNSHINPDAISNMSALVMQYNSLDEAIKQLSSEDLDNIFSDTDKVFKSDGTEQSLVRLQEIQKIITDITGETVEIETGIDGTQYLDMASFSSSDFLKVYQEMFSNEDLSSLIETYFNDNLNSAKQSINKYYSEQLPLILQGVHLDDSFKELDGSTKLLVDSLISKLDYSSIATSLHKDYDDDIFAYLNDTLLNGFYNLSDDDKSLVKDYYTQLLTIDENASLAQNIPIIQDYITKLSELLGISEDQLKIALGYDLEADKDLIKRAQKRVTGNTSTNSYDKYGMKNAEVNGAIATLNKSDLELLINNDLSEASKIKTEEDLHKFLDTLREKAKSEEIEISTTINMTKSLDSVKSAFNNLNEVFKDYESNGLKGMDISNLTSLNDEKTFGKINGSTKAYEDFLAVMQDVNATAEDVQNAFDKLATEYIYHSDLVNQITEDNKDYIISELEKNGITNATAVAEQMFINKYGAEEIAISEVVQANLSLKDVKLDSSNAGEQLKNATADEILALANEANQAGKTYSALYYLALQKELANKSSLTTDGDIANLVALGRQLGVNAELLQRYGELKRRLNTLPDNAPSSQVTAIEQDLKNLLARINQQVMYSGTTTNSGGTHSGSGSNSSSGSSGSGSSSTAKETKSLFNFIEIKLKKYQKLLDDTINKAKSFFEYVRSNAELDWGLYLVQANIQQQRDAYGNYLAKLDSIGLDESIAAQVRDGSMNIAEYDSDTADKINEYQKWYEKMQDCLTAIEELNEQQRKLANQKLDNIINYYDAYNNAFSAQAGSYASQVDYLNAHGKSQIGNEMKTAYKNQLSQLRQQELSMQVEYANYESLLNKQFGSGLITTEDYLKGLEYLAKLKSSIYDINVEIRELDSTISGLKITELVIDLDALDREITKIQDNIKLEETIGNYDPTTVLGEYNDLLYYYSLQVKNIKKQINEYTDKLVQTEVYSELWVEYSENIADLTSKLTELNISIQDTHDLIIQLALKPFNDARQAVDRYKSSISGLNSLITDDMVLDDNGALTNLGTTKVAMYSEQYKAIQKQLKEYKNELAEIDKMWAKGQAGLSEDEYNEMRQSAVDGIISSMSELQSISSSVIQIIENQLKAELDIINKVIDARTKALKKKKEYYDYDKQIRTKTKDVQSIENQITALEATEDSLEKRKQLLELQQQLNEKKEDLKDTKIEHQITLVTDGLSNFSTDLSEKYDEQVKALKSSFEAQLEVMNSVTNMWSSCSKVIKTVIKNIGDTYGVDVSKYIGDTSKDLDGLAKFATGGIIRASGVSTDGDKINVRVNPNETILTQDFTELLPTTVDIMENFINSNTPNYSNLPSIKSNSINTSPIINLNIQGNADKQTVLDLQKLMPKLTEEVATKLAKDLKKSGW